MPHDDDTLPQPTGPRPPRRRRAAASSSAVRPPELPPPLPWPGPATAPEQHQPLIDDWASALVGELGAALPASHDAPQQPSDGDILEAELPDTPTAPDGLPDIPPPSASPQPHIEHPAEPHANWSERAARVLADSAQLSRNGPHGPYAAYERSSAPRPRGIQQSDVWAAADALITQGQRPTIERVRQHIGRGSPNTVAPLLDAWYATLGQRLRGSLGTQIAHNAPAPEGQDNPAPEALPAAVADAAGQLWQAALLAARHIAQDEQAQAREALEAQQQKLQSEQAEFQRKESHFQEQKQAIDAALQLARTQHAEQAKMLAALQTQLNEREAAHQTAQAAAQEQLQAARHNLDAAQSAAAQERQRLAEQHAGNERRLLQALDEARQSAEKQRKNYEEAQRQLHTLQQHQQEMQQQHQQLEQQLRQQIEKAEKYQQEHQLANDARTRAEAALLALQTELRQTQAALTAPHPAPRPPKPPIRPPRRSLRPLSQRSPRPR